MSNNNTQTTKVITGKVRFSYVNIFKSRSFQTGQDEKFSICLLIPKKDKETIRKIKAAIELLQDGENVSNVAERIGFGSQSYFSKAFKRETGISPSEFKTSENAERTK